MKLGNSIHIAVYEMTPHEIYAISNKSGSGSDGLQTTISGERSVLESS